MQYQDIDASAPNYRKSASPVYPVASFPVQPATPQAPVNRGNGKKAE